MSELRQLKWVIVFRGFDDAVTVHVICVGGGLRTA